MLTQANEAYRCIRTLIVNDYFIEKTRIHMQKEIFLWRDLKLLVTPSTYWLEDHILNQMSYIEGGIGDKIEDHIERR